MDLDEGFFLFHECPVSFFMQSSAEFKRTGVKTLCFIQPQLRGIEVVEVPKDVIMTVCYLMCVVLVFALVFTLFIVYVSCNTGKNSFVDEFWL